MIKKLRRKCIILIKITIFSGNIIIDNSLTHWRTHHLGMKYYVKLLGHLGIYKVLAPMAIEKTKILGAVLELPAK
jgi:hypothetical protein